MNKSGNLLESIQFLCDLLRPHSVRLTKRETSFNLQCKTAAGDHAYILLLEGSAAIFRSNDNLMLANVTAPSIFGIAESISGQNNIKIKSSSDAILYRIDSVTADKLIDIHHAQNKVIVLLSFIIMNLYQRNTIMINRTAYEIIRDLLYDINKMDDNYRSDVNVCQYIVSRTGLSRSRTHTILKALKEGEYISLVHGKLLGISKTLPEEF